MNKIETADIIVFKKNDNNKICILLGKRCNEKNFSGKYCIPGGHLKPTENPIDGAVRELNEETNLDISSLKNKLKLIYLFHPDPSVEWKKSYGAVFTLALPKQFNYNLKPQAEEMSDVRWYEVDQIPFNNMAFDHGSILKKILSHMTLY